MKTSRSRPIGVLHAERRLGIVAAACARQDGQSNDEIAAQQGGSPALVYKLLARTQCLAGDDIFFPREALKFLMEPVDAAVLEVLRWPDRSAESWQLWLDDWPAL